MDVVMRKWSCTTSNVFEWLWRWICWFGGVFSHWQEFSRISFLLDPVELDEWLRTCICDIGCIRVPGMDKFMVRILQLPTMAHLTTTVSFLCVNFFELD